MEDEERRSKKSKKKKANSLPRAGHVAVDPSSKENEHMQQPQQQDGGLRKSSERPKGAEISPHGSNRSPRKKSKIKKDKDRNEREKERELRESIIDDKTAQGMRRSERLQQEIKKLQRILQELEKEKYQHGLIQKDFERIKHIKVTIEKDLDRNRRKQLAIIKEKKGKTWDNLSSEIQKAKEEIRRKKARELWEKDYLTAVDREREREIERAQRHRERERERARQRERERERERFKERERKERREKKEREKEKKKSPREKLEILVTSPPANVSPKLTHRVKLLDKWMKHRPTWSEDVEEKNKKREREIVENINEVRQKTFRSSAELLELLLKNRPSSQELELRGILKDEEKSERKKRKREERLERELSNKQMEKEIELTIRDKYYHAHEDWYRAEKEALDLLLYEAETESCLSSSGSSSCRSSQRWSDKIVLSSSNDESGDLLTEGTEGTNSEYSSGGGGGEGMVAFKEVNYCDIVFHPNGRLGGGSFGDVFIAVVPGVPGRVAVKILKGRSLKCEQAFHREIEALKRTRTSDYTVKLRGWSSDVHYCIITELCEGGSIEHVIHKKGQKLSLQQAVRIGTKIVECMDYLHSLSPPILHRDIAPGNIFLHPDVDGRVCLGDFGIAVMKTETRNIRLSKNGNPRYRAPEVSKGEPYSRKADVYSFGNLFFEMLTGIRPFEELESGQITAQIISGETPKFPRGSGIPKDLRRITKACWFMNPSDRPSFRELMSGLSKHYHQQHG